ncbi:helix-turn-helix domain-containing protein [Xenorhabdus anantnagensis]|uniref:Helix-turn-helix domain-containing protein n=1 Tax=Xenorhabdus anantnagensis TaxID=3025875 RepID=A0ABT5LTC2_9GAMM|nr:helix-turn-helix domain-containing protein [Xenorhabdus anantnagensis]MDC9596270.1 helix-turn-helix domain-containing protein [Xenorhabdus anantnagensis]
MNKLIKPLDSFNEVINVLLPHSELITTDLLTQGKSIKIDSEFLKIFLLDQGYVNIRRIDDELIIATLFSPYVIGLSFYPGAGIYYSIELGGNCKIYQIPRSSALSTIRTHNLYKEWLRIFSYKMSFLYARDISIFRHNNREVVYNLLSRLMNSPMEFRKNITVIKYIEQRCTISRSCIQRVLLSLKKEGCIELVNGYLEKVLSLPTQSYY